MQRIVVFVKHRLHLIIQTFSKIILLLYGGTYTTLLFANPDDHLSVLLI